MIRLAADWLATLRALGESFLEVLRAELAAFQRDATVSARLLLKGARLVILALILLFWTVGTLVFAGVAVLSSGWSLPLWLSALIVGGVLLLGAIVLRFWAVATFRRVDGPGTLVRRHATDHTDWLKDELGMSAERSDDGS